MTGGESRGALVVYRSSMKVERIGRAQAGVAVDSCVSGDSYCGSPLLLPLFVRGEIYYLLVIN
eukprot:3972210-Pyramimonas_sp.AAC.2